MNADFAKQIQAGPAEQLSKSRKKFLATTYKPLFTSLYACDAHIARVSKCFHLTSNGQERGIQEEGDAYALPVPGPLQARLCMSKMMEQKGAWHMCYLSAT